MGLFSFGADTFYAFRFLRLLTTKWEKTGAFKAGLIDKDGKILRKPENSAERSVYNIFHRLVFNIKKLINKVPLGKTTIASYLAALYLIKEHTGLTDAEIVLTIKEAQGCKVDIMVQNINESKESSVEAGTYTLNRSIPHPKTGEIIALENTEVEFTEDTTPHGFIFGYPLFEAIHTKTNQTILVSNYDITPS
jgi:hypothetical protein